MDYTKVKMEKKENSNRSPRSKPSNQPLGGERNNLCRSWGTESGCRFGKQCRYEHPQLPDAASRCWWCSSTQHRKNECPHKPMPTAAGSQAGGSDGGKNDGGKGKQDQEKGSGKTNKGTKGKGQKGKGGSPPQAPVVNKVEAESKEETSGKADTTATSTTSPEKPAAGEADLLSEVTSLLRSLRAPQLRAVYVRKVDAANEGSYLLDGGATHCLRRARNEAEWDSGMPQEVHLAMGSVVLRQLPNGTLLTQSPTQPIIPLNDLTKVGVTVHWSEGMFSMSQHGRKLRVYMDQGCPCVSEVEGRRLMSEVGEMYDRQVKMRKVQSRSREELTTDEEQSLRRFMDLFPSVPMAIPKDSNSP